MNHVSDTDNNSGKTGGGFVEVRGLRKVYDGVVAVDQVDLSVSEGDIVTLLGPSGCGKTTTLRCIAGLETPTAGAISIAGTLTDDAGFHAPPRQRNIGMVFQGFALWPHMKVRDNVAFPLRRRGIRGIEMQSRTDAILALVGLEGRADHYPGQLSGGQQQRVALARALVAEPKVILYDEPLSSLDAKLREQIRQEIRELHKRLRITAVYVTHDQEEAMDISDLIYVMRDGRIVQGGRPVELSDSPRDLFVCEFFGRSNLFAIAGVQDLGEGLLAVQVTGGRRLQARLQPGRQQPAHLAIRPYRLQLRPQGTPGDPARVNEFAGQVGAVRSFGARIIYTLVLDDGGKIEAEALRTSGHHGIGDRLIAACSPDDCILMS